MNVKIKIREKKLQFVFVANHEIMQYTKVAFMDLFRVATVMHANDFTRKEKKIILGGQE